jgi:hypothetical protein
VGILLKHCPVNISKYVEARNCDGARLAYKRILFYKHLFARELNTYTAEPESTKIAPV